MSCFSNLKSVLGVHVSKSQSGKWMQGCKAEEFHFGVSLPSVLFSNCMWVAFRDIVCYKWINISGRPFCLQNVYGPVVRVREPACQLFPLMTSMSHSKKKKKKRSESYELENTRLGCMGLSEIQVGLPPARHLTKTNLRQQERCPRGG